MGRGADKIDGGESILLHNLELAGLLVIHKPNREISEAVRLGLQKKMQSMP